MKSENFQIKKKDMKIMTKFEELQNDIKSAMISKDSLKRDCLRTIVSEIKNQTVNAGKPITDEICLKTIQKSVKMHNDSISQFKTANRLDLAEKEETELKILRGYLPKMLSENEMHLIVDSLVVDSKIDPVKKNIGQFMKLLAKYRSKMDMSAASNYLKSKLS